jgi:hypothetical protein
LFDAFFLSDRNKPRLKFPIFLPIYISPDEN